MNRARSIRLIVVCAGVLLLLGGVGAATAHRNAAAASSPADEVRAAELTYLRASVNADTQTLSKVLAPDFQLIDVTGSAESRKVYFSILAGPVDFQQIKPVSPIRVHVYGNAAVARVKLAFRVIAQGTKLVHSAWDTELFERRGGQWQLLWSQTTPHPNNLALLLKALEPTH